MTVHPEMGLPTGIVNAIRSALQNEEGFGAIRRLERPKLVSDQMDKYLILDHQAKPRALVAVSPVSRPRAAREAGEHANAARLALGEVLGQSVLVPTHVGECNTLSFSISPYLMPLSERRLKRRIQQWRLSPSLFRWLWQVVERTARMPSQVEIDREFRKPLHQVLNHPKLSERAGQLASAALLQLESGEWQPRLVLAHYDFWTGNILLRPRNDNDDFGFAVIDWLGSRMAGHPIYDLVRITLSLGISDRNFDAHLAAHCRVLGCEPSQATHYVSAATGHLAIHLGEWPEEKFIGSTERCFDLLTRNGGR
jgi:Phosphotransferase enzyme family